MSHGFPSSRRTASARTRSGVIGSSFISAPSAFETAFAVVAAVQASIVSGIAFGALDLHVAGSAWAVLGLAIANALLGMALGLFASAFARTEFQAVQCLPAFVFPQLLLCGLIVPHDQMARALELVSYGIPLRYA